MSILERATKWPTWLTIAVASALSFLIIAMGLWVLVLSIAGI